MYEEAHEYPMITRNQFEKLLRSAFLRQENYNTLDRQQTKHKPGLVDTTASPSKSDSTAGHDQLRVIYDF